MFDTEAVKPLLDGVEHFPGRGFSSDAQILDAFRRSVSTVYHASSTCEMGKKVDGMAVVDSRGTGFGTRGLRVVDASTFPFLLPGYPMATICELLSAVIVWQGGMLTVCIDASAEKIADDIRGGRGRVDEC